MEIVGDRDVSDDNVARVDEIDADDEEVTEPTARENVGVGLPEIDNNSAVREVVSELDLEFVPKIVGLSVR